VRKLLFGTVALIALVAPATAADLGQFRIAPAPVVPVWNLDRLLRGRSDWLFVGEQREMDRTDAGRRLFRPVAWRT
jgi:hypothetical protein